jgi:hypothetical protein
LSAYVIFILYCCHYAFLQIRGRIFYDSNENLSEILEKVI